MPDPFLDILRKSAQILTKFRSLARIVSPIIALRGYSSGKFLPLHTGNPGDNLLTLVLRGAIHLSPLSVGSAVLTDLADLGWFFHRLVVAFRPILTLAKRMPGFRPTWPSILRCHPMQFPFRRGSLK